MPAAPVQTSSGLPPVTLAHFEGPLDLLLHLIREHKIDIADIPIVQIADYYLAFLRDMEAMNLTIAGEFLVMAATLLEIKSRMLLPKPPKEAEDEEEGSDPREQLVRRLQDYQRFKAFIGTLAEWEDARRQLFFRGQGDYGDLYQLPVSFGELSSKSLVNALMRVLADAGETGHDDVTSVKRQKLTLRLAMASLWRKVERAGAEGVSFGECFELPLIRLNIVMTFLALLELLRQSRIEAKQETMLGEIRIFMVSSVADDTTLDEEKNS